MSGAVRSKEGRTAPPGSFGHRPCGGGSIPPTFHPAYGRGVRDAHTLHRPSAVSIFEDWQPSCPNPFSRLLGLSSAHLPCGLSGSSPQAREFLQLGATGSWNARTRSDSPARLGWAGTLGGNAWRPSGPPCRLADRSAAAPLREKAGSDDSTGPSAMGMALFNVTRRRLMERSPVIWHIGTAKIARRERREGDFEVHR